MMFCAGEVMAPAVEPVKQSPQGAPQKLLPIPGSREEATLFENLAKASLEKRLALAGVPKDLTGAAAEDFAVKKQLENLPVAVAEAEYRLKYGDDDQRWEAAKWFADATGHGKKETGQGGGSAVIIIQGMGTAGGQLPWMQKVEPKAIEAGTEEDSDAQDSP